MGVIVNVIVGETAVKFLYQIRDVVVSASLVNQVITVSIHDLL